MIKQQKGEELHQFSQRETHITPSTNDVEQVVFAKRQVEDALIYSF
jgi:hypothetical protein